MGNKRRAVISAIAVLVLAAVYFMRREVHDYPEEITYLYGSSDREIREEEVSETVPVTSGNICVYISGSVRNPGVYELEKGARVYEVLERAGGFSADADRNRLNLAETLTDGEHIRVYGFEEKTGTEDADDSEDTVNINTADMERLCTLPGIGQAKAQAILDYRNRNGSFSCIEDIMNVSGIGQGMFERIRDKIKV